MWSMACVRIEYYNITEKVLTILHQMMVACTITFIISQIACVHSRHNNNYYSNYYIEVCIIIYACLNSESKNMHHHINVCVYIAYSARIL